MVEFFMVWIVIVKGVNEDVKCYVPETNERMNHGSVPQLVFSCWQDEQWKYDMVKFEKRF